MNPQEIAKYTQRLHSRLPLLGPRLRRSACRKLAEDPSSGSVPHLAEALHSDDPEVRSTADVALRALKDAGAVDALCELAIADPAGPVAALVKEMGHQHRSVSRRCVLFLLTGQLERYFDLDFELQHLRAEYQAGDEGLRRRIGEMIGQSGDTRLIGLFRESRRRKLASELTEREAAIVLDVHARNRQWSEIFALLFQIPLASAVAALDLLGGSGWRPESGVEAPLLDELIEIRSAIGEIPERPPAPDVALGPVPARWIERGRGPELVGQSPDTLRKTLAQASPPEAVAVLAALASNGKIAAGDIEAARTHPHWLVRLACLALCEIAPQFAFSKNPTGGDGGGMWIDRLAPAVLDAAVYRRRAVSLNPDQLGALQAALGVGKSPKDGNPKTGRWACGRLVEALARHHLRHTIEVDEQMTVEISETAIEIEVEG